MLSSRSLLVIYFKYSGLIWLLFFKHHSVCWWIDIPHFVRKRGVKGGLEIVVDQVHGLSYYYLRWDKIQGVGLGGVRKEGQKFSFKIKFERLVRNTPWILCMLSDIRVKFRGEVRFKIHISELSALETVLKTKNYIKWLNFF